MKKTCKNDCGKKDQQLPDLLVRVISAHLYFCDIEWTAL